MPKIKKKRVVSNENSYLGLLIWLDSLFYKRI